MKKIIYLFAAVVALFTMSCNSSKNNMKEDLNGEWNVVAVNGQEINVLKTIPYLGFDMDAKKMSGFMGCNRLLGTIETDSLHPAKISFANVGSTRMMCPDMSLEQQIADAVNKVQSYETSAKGINLLDADGIVVINLVKREAEKEDISLLEGKWMMKTVKDQTISGLEKTPYLEFNVADHKVSGFGGCNLINGEFEQEEGVAFSLKFVQMVSTMMSCPDMDVESAIMKLMGEVAGYEIEGKGNDATLTLLNAEQEKIIFLSRN